MSSERTAALAAAAARLGAAAIPDAPLGARTTYRVGGSAAIGVEPADEDALLAVARVIGSTTLPVLVVGKGSNLLVSDAGFPGIAIFISEGFTGIEIEGSNVVAGGGASLPIVARKAASAGLTGLEWAVGVPGSVGGAVRMNAGGHGSDMAASLERARVIDLRSATARWIQPADLALAYRSSGIAWTDVVVAAELRCVRGDRDEAEARIAEVVRWRRANQPGGQNAGSVFTNPAGDHAGRLVEAAGAKGLRLGTAQVSPKHANFIQADEGGSAEDVKALVEEVRRRVEAHSGVVLHSEIRLIGFPDTYPHPMEPGPHGG
ncbi:MAG: UDP-N-acetylmuramate dehydrogenase [Acidimicrobiales bacterium]